MTLFIDNDVLAKLASWNLLEEGVRACGFELSAVRYLPTARYVLRMGQTRCRYSVEVQQRIEALFAAGKASDDDAADQDRNLPQVPDIDPGEAILIAQAARAAGSLLVTGDKKCIRAAAAALACRPLVQRLAGRVLCLEQVLLRVNRQLGFEEVRKRVVESRQLELDTSVRSAFGSGNLATEENAIGSLKRRVKELASDAGDLLAAEE